MCLAQGQNTVTPVRLEPTAPRSRVKHSTTEPLCSLNCWSSARAGIHRIVRIANREDPDQTASSEAVWSGSALFVMVFLPGN